MLTITRGDDKSIGLTFPAGTNLSGSTVYFTVKPEASVTQADPTDQSAVLKTQTTTHTEPAAGKTVIELTAELTSVVPPGDYVYDIQVKHSNGKVRTYNNGPQQLTVLADVTQRTS